MVKVDLNAVITEIVEHNSELTARVWITRW
jgi:hypothetical protein